MSQEFNDKDLEKFDISDSEEKIAVNTDSYNSEDYQEDAEEGAGLARVFHITLITLIVIIAGASIYLLARWQKGTAPDVTDQNGVNAYDVESEDFYVPHNPASMEGYVDDGELNIVIIGDDTMFQCQDETGIPSLIAQATGANVTTLALPGVTVSLKERSYTEEFAEDAFNLYYVITSICGGDMGSYDLMFNALSHIDDNSLYYNYWDVIHNIKFDRVDTLIISCGYNDYLEGRPLIGDEVYSEQQYGLKNSVAGSLSECVSLLQERFPYMQIIISSPHFCFTQNEDGEFVGVDVYNTGIGTLGDYIVNMKYIATENRISFVDNYFYQDFNFQNYEDFLSEDRTTLNETGRRIIAEHIIPFIYTGN